MKQSRAAEYKVRPLKESLSTSTNKLNVCSTSIAWHSSRGTVHILSGASEAGLTRDSFLLQDKINVLEYSTLLVLTWHVLTDMVQVIEGNGPSSALSGLAALQKSPRLYKPRQKSPLYFLIYQERSVKTS